ncbi:MAG: hypothetical protein GY810_06290 [Aureispira sp.]|nr:hypothetical protein [Aureispira sp.]
MKEYWKIVLLGIGLFFIGCQSTPEPLSEEKIIAEEDEKELEEEFIDSLELKQGEIPEDWEKIDLGKGYYIAFPQEPRKKEKKQKKQINYKLKKKKYSFVTNITSLSEEESFAENRERRNAYYKAIVHDLIEGISKEDNPAELVLQQPFYFLEIYEGLKAIVEADDVTVFVQYIIIGDTLYAISFVLWSDVTDAILQMKDKYFYSFGKELYIE